MGFVESDRVALDGVLKSNAKDRTDVWLRNDGRIQESVSLTSPKNHPPGFFINDFDNTPKMSFGGPSREPVAFTKVSGPPDRHSPSPSTPSNSS